MTLAMLITESRNLVDEANAAYMGGEPEQARRWIRNLYGILHQNKIAFEANLEPEPEKPATTQESDQPKEGDG